ncbi:MAG: HAD family hydrolase [candidate division WOR-3 bacterium]|nr:HAD family hydrolase [candidate division WOR-3 bacterium]MCX7947623.1 HAD family hydrolase [candidate division WOR-3 bacterium]MDW8150367.1 HAD family hydrolase [candidate division WOR-3 bacterium]
MFDFDGTIFDTSLGLTLSINELLRRYKLLELNSKEVKKIIGGGIELTLRRIFNENFKEELIEEFNEVYKNFMHEGLKPYDNVINVIEKLKKEKGFIVVIYTNKSKNFVIDILRKFNILEFFDEIITIDDGFKKPDKEAIDYLERTYNIKKENMYIIGDSEFDIQTAKISGIKSIFVNWGFGENIGADFEVNEPYEIYEILNSK